MTPDNSSEPDWELLNLLREVRRRARSANAGRYLAQLSEEPRWVAALPKAEARIARTMLEATRELALRSAEAMSSTEALNLDLGAPVAAAIKPRRTRKRRG